MLKRLKKAKLLHLKTIKKLKLPFMVDANFKSVILSKNNAKQHGDEFYTNKYQIHVGSSFGYKLSCTDK